jgi:hypothetical protein
LPHSYLSGCGGKILKETVARPASQAAAKVNNAISTWLGNPSRNFFGTGPWTDGPLVKVWEVETKWTTGPLHEDPWSGTSWPGQPAVDEHHVYFAAADSYLYCLDIKDGSVVWTFKAQDSLKATLAIAADRLLVSVLIITSIALINRQAHCSGNSRRDLKSTVLQASSTVRYFSAGKTVSTTASTWKMGRSCTRLKDSVPWRAARQSSTIRSLLLPSWAISSV